MPNKLHSYTTRSIIFDMKPGLPKKYAKMGFKEGWKAYKKAKKSKKGSLIIVNDRRKSKQSGGRKMSKKTSIISTARGIAYLGIPALQTKFDYDSLILAGRTPQDAMKQAVGTWAGKSPSDGTFSWDIIIDQYTPIATWTVADWGLQKLGVYRRISRLLPRL